MQTLAASVWTTYEIKQSKFIAHLILYRDFNTVLQQLQAEHPKARHFVTAFRYRNEFSQVVEGSSDDGEPRGTSGKPSLAVLAGHDLIDVAVITVRYFGGTKLGTGGLVRAYTHAVSDAVSAAEMIPYVPMHSAAFSSSYSDVGKIEHTLGFQQITSIEKTFESDKVLWKVEASATALEAFFTSIGRLVHLI